MILYSDTWCSRKYPGVEWNFEFIREHIFNLFLVQDKYEHTVISKSDIIDQAVPHYPLFIRNKPLIRGATGAALIRINNIH